jgi:sortase B
MAGRESESAAPSAVGAAAVKILALILGLAATAVTALLVAALGRNGSDLSESKQEYEDLAQTVVNAQAAEYVSEFDEEMRGINGDYVFWLTIDGTTIDYPVVRGADNETYLSRSFYGEDNKFGALFIDYRCVGDYVPHIIVFGHNTQSGHMFGDLKNFLDEDFLKEHPTITVTIGGRSVEYEIVKVRQTDVNDPVYDLDFSVPGSFAAFIRRCGISQLPEQVITLSTCVSRGNDAERVIVQGILIDEDVKESEKPEEPEHLFR